MAFSAEPNRSSQAIFLNQEWLEDSRLSVGTTLSLQTDAESYRGRYHGRTLTGGIVLAVPRDDVHDWVKVAPSKVRALRIRREPQLLIPTLLGVAIGAGAVALNDGRDASVKGAGLGMGIGAALGLGLGVMMGIDPSYELDAGERGRRLAPYGGGQRP